MKNYKQEDESPAHKFKRFCEERGLECGLIPCVGRQDRFHSKKLIVAGKLVRIRKLNQADFYYKLHPTVVRADYVAYAIPDSNDWLVLPFELARQSTMFSLAPDLDRAAYSQRHSWPSFVNNVQPFNATQSTASL